jgi:hypothetical protein
MEYEISRRGHSKIIENGFTFGKILLKKIISS